MAIYGESYSKFKASDTTVVSLNHSIVEPSWAVPQLIKNTSVFTRETAFTKLVDDFAEFIVTVNIWKNTVPGDAMEAILPYNHDTVNFMPHQDSGIYVLTPMPDLLSGWDFTSGWTTGGGASITDSDTFTTSSDGWVKNSVAVTIGNQYRLTIDGTVTDGGIQAYRGTSLAGVDILGTGFGSYDFTATSNGISLRNRDASTNNLYIITLTELVNASFYIESMTPVYVKNKPPILEDKLIIKFVSLEAVDASGSIP